MTNTLWEFSIENKTATKTWTGKLGNVYITAGFNKTALVSHFVHTIDEAKLYDLSYNPVFELVPNEFKLEGIQPKEEFFTFNLNTDIVVHSFNKSQAHLVLHALYSLIKNKTTGNELVAYINETSVCILFQQNGNLLIGNSYEIENYAEIVYFFTACANQFGLSTSNINYTIVSSITETDLRKVLDDFIANQHYIAIELPYAKDKFPPFSAELYLLMLLNTCELPAES